MRVRVFLGLVLLVGPALVPGALGLEAASPGTDRQDRLLVALETWPPARGVLDAIAQEAGHVEETFPKTRALLVHGDGSLGAELRRTSTVAEVSPETELTPNLAASRQAVNLTAPGVETQRHDTQVTVAVVNGGIDADHPGLKGSVVQEFEVTPDGVHPNASGSSRHGTHVAGILSGTGEGGDSDRGDLAGVAPGTDIVSLDISAEFTASNALRAFEWIAEHHDDQDIRVVLSSWGRMRDPARYQADDPIIRASDALVRQGLVVVFSAGNGGPSESAMTVEATNPNVLSVGATNGAGQAASFSSRGPVMDDGEQATWTKPDLVAPGNRIVSTRASASGAGAGYVTMNGTSMAAPHVAGAAALVLSERPGLAPAEVKEVLVETARDLGEPGVDETTGAGLLDVGAALERLGALPEPPSSPDTPASIGDTGESSDANEVDRSSIEGSLDSMKSVPQRPRAASSLSEAPDPRTAALTDRSSTKLALGLLVPQVFAGLIARATTEETSPAGTRARSDPKRVLDAPHRHRATEPQSPRER